MEPNPSPEMLKEQITRLIAGLRQRPGGTQATFRTSTRRESGLHCSVQARGRHTVAVDESQRIGGTDQGMNPVELLLGALGTCQEIVYTIHAALLDIPLDGVRIECRARLDPRGFLGADESVPAGLLEVEFETYLESSAQPERIRELVSIAERRCPVMDTLARQVPASGRAFLNGKPIHGAGEPG